MPNINASQHSEHAAIERIVREVNSMPPMLQRRIQLSIDGTIGRVIIKVVDSATDTVIKEMPPVELQKIYRNIRSEIEKIVTVQE